MASGKLAMALEIIRQHERRSCRVAQRMARFATSAGMKSEWKYHELDAMGFWEHPDLTISVYMPGWYWNQETNWRQQYGFGSYPIPTLGAIVAGLLFIQNPHNLKWHLEYQSEEGYWQFLRHQGALYQVAQQHAGNGKPDPFNLDNRKFHQLFRNYLEWWKTHRS